MTLYELNEQWQSIFEMLENPEIPEDAIFDTIEGIEIVMAEKAENYGKMIKSFADMASACEDEAKRLRERANGYKKRADELKQNLYGSMKLTGQAKIKTPMFTFWTQANPESVKVNDVEQLFALGYVKPLKVTEDSLDKTAIKEAIKAGKLDANLAEIVKTEGIRMR